ncbi:MAG TPA: 3-deoxy-8-phosphooctulonate synthase, partial [Gemmatimonadales bacterium]|nr:3-deoxy-8-phosphooctulonate synthase [Gemmatimonadales bacterium]
MNRLWGPGPVLVAGPCLLDSPDVNRRIGDALAELGRDLGITVVFKASFDKANRAGPRAPRGPGLERGLAALEQVRGASGLPVLTDIHEPGQAEPAAKVVDALQVPAFLCRQTDLLLAAGAAGKPVNLKKGQWLAPEAMEGAVGKLRAGGARDIAVTERGTFFGYGDLVVDMRSFRRMRRATGCPVLYDATHAVQLPGSGPGGSSGGSREDVPALLRAAAGAGADGFFLETHP